jgi:thymidylate kinase
MSDGILPSEAEEPSDHMRTSETGAQDLDAAALRAAKAFAGRRLRRGRPVVVAISGVDGSGKSTLSRRMSQELEQVGVDVVRIWARPGSGLGFIGAMLDTLKGWVRADTTTGSRRVAAPNGPTPVSRRGALGWSWALIVTLAYLVDVRRQHRRACGVAIYDRHGVDAEVSLDFLYGGGGRRLHKLLVRLVLPSADLAYYVEVDVDTALERKPGNAFGRYAIEEQLWRYQAAMGEDLRVLDGSLPPEQLVGRVLNELADHVGERC